MKVTILGLSGGMGTGKDTVASGFIKGGYVRLAFATPLYSLARSVFHGVEGDKFSEFETFDTLLELWGGPSKAPRFDRVAGSVTYNLPRIARETDLVALTKAGSKPRAFLQYVGDYVRDVQADAFAEYLGAQVVRTVKRELRDWETKIEAIEANGEVPVFTMADDESQAPVKQVRINPFHVGFVVTDLRFANELKVLQQLPSRIQQQVSPELVVNFKTIKLTCPTDVAALRVAERDEIPVAQVEAALSHKSEAGLADDQFSAVVDTNRDLGEVIADVIAVMRGEKVESAPAEEATEEIAFIPGTRVVDLESYRAEREVS